MEQLIYIAQHYVDTAFLQILEGLDEKIDVMNLNDYVSLNGLCLRYSCGS